MSELDVQPIVTRTLMQDEASRRRVAEAALSVRFERRDRRRHGAVRPRPRDAVARRRRRRRPRLARPGSGAGGSRGARRRRRGQRRVGARGGAGRPRDECGRHARDGARAFARIAGVSVASELRSDEPVSLAERLADVVDVPVVAGLHSLAAGKLGGEPPDEDAFVCGDDADAKAMALELAQKLVRGRAVDAGPLRSARGARGDDRRARRDQPPLQDPRGPARHRPPVTLTILPLEGLPEVGPGADIADLVTRSRSLEDGDVVVLAQKIVSKAEGRVMRLDDVEPSQRARELAGAEGDARQVEAILRESVRVVRTRGPLVIAETRARLRLRVRGRGRVERAGARHARPAAGRPRRLGPAASAAGRRVDRPYRRGSSSATPSGGRGGRERRTSRSASPAWRRCSTCGARRTRQATSCARRRSPSRTSSPARPSS